MYEIIPEPEVEVYLTIAEFTATAGDGISFETGQECTVVTKNPAGWWYVDMDGQEGWVPSSYLERKPTSPTPSHASSKSPTSPNIPAEKARKDPPTDPKAGGWVKKADIKKKEMLRKEPMKKEAARENSTPRVRNRSLSNSSVDGEPQRPLQRSTSTDSGLYEEVGFKKKELSSLHSPPSIRRTSNVPPKPSRPKATPTLPNTKTISSVKSPQVDRKTLRPTISGPLPFQPSPNTKKRSDGNALRKITPTKPAAMLGARSPQSKPASHAAVNRGGSEDSWVMVPGGGSSNHVGNHLRPAKNKSSPELKVRELAGGGSTSSGRRGTGDLLSSRPPPTHKRHGSTDSSSGNIYKQELAKRLMDKPTPANATLQPKRPSPPNRPKAPPTKQSMGGKVRPSRPKPPKPTAGKKPTPPRPYGSPKVAKKTAYVTIGDYTGDDPSSCLSFKDGEEVEVLERSSDGWWFIKIGKREGWAPSTYIQEKQTSPGPARPHPPRPKPPPPVAVGTATLPGSRGTSKKVDMPTEDDAHPKPKPRPRPRKSTSVFYRAIDSYEVPVYEDSGLTLVQGRVYELKEKSDTGWWLMKDGDIEGWAPSNYFKMA